MKKNQNKEQTMKDVVQRPIEFKKDMAKFYDVNPSLTKNIDLNQIVIVKGKENENGNTEIKSSAK